MAVSCRSALSQCLPAFIVTLICFVFGLMLGWPSSTYSYLLQPTSVVPITWNQSAMLAGFLMLGAAISSPFSLNQCMGTKFGIIFCFCCNLIGWIIIWFANSFFCLLAGRFFIGICAGYGINHAKNYINDICEPNCAEVLKKFLQINLSFGALVAFIIGSFVDYNCLNLICMLISVVILAISMLLPHTPVEYINYTKDSSAMKILLCTYTGNFGQEKMTKIREGEIFIKQEMEVPMSKILKHPRLRVHLTIVYLLTFFQQYVGIPPTIVYCKIIFQELKMSNPEIYAIAYCFLYVIMSILGSFRIVKCNKKIMLVFSNCMVGLILACIIVALKLNIPEKHPYICVALLFLYQFFYNLGFGIVPADLIDDFFPKNCRKRVFNYYFAIFCISALTITKIFQVVYIYQAFYLPFCLFLGVSIISLLFTIFVVPEKPNCLDISV